MKWFDAVPNSKKRTTLSMLLGLIISLFYVFMWEPTRTQIDMIQRDIQQLELEIQRNTNKTKKLTELRAGIEELEKEFLRRGELYHQKDQEMGLRQHVMRLAENNRLAVVLWRPGLAEKNSQDGIESLPVHVRVEGGYHQVAKFFVEVLHVPAISQINELTMSVENDLTQNRTLLTDFILTTMEMSASGTVPKLVSSQEGPVLQRAGS